MNENEYLNVKGGYTAFIDQPQSGWLTQKEGKTPAIRIPLEITQEGDQKGKKAIWMGYLSEKALDRTIRSIAEATGWDGDFARLDSIVGTPVHIEADYEEYEGVRRCKVKWLNNINGGGAAGMDEADAQSLIKALQAKTKAIAKDALAGGHKPATTAAPKMVAADVDDQDEIPFP